jgi:hypothetical protein
MSATAIFVGRREGRFSLIWAVGFYCLSGLVWVPNPPWWLLLVWFFAWWGVSLPFAVSGLRRGDVRNRIYAGISLAAFALFVYALLHEGSGT